MAAPTPRHPDTYQASMSVFPGDGKPMPNTNVVGYPPADSNLDSMNVNKMGKGDMKTSAIFVNSTAATLTDDPVNMCNHKHVAVEITVDQIAAGNILLELIGCATVNGTYGNEMRMKDDGAFVPQRATINANGSYVFTFRDLGSRWIKARTTRTTDGRVVSVRYTPFN
ncbi:hypothetical protein ACFFSY_13865 [Paenibacillus aurantiacus]|uniref:Uncharacterized protein n=1 Tax=Paenibacillus aurantiacus TaxID=1936118 RepID=A0ABV5KP56_9BACL